MSKNTTDNTLNLSYFFRNNEPEIAEYPAPPSFKDEDGKVIKLQFRILSEKEIREIRSHWRVRNFVTGKNGLPMLAANGNVVVDTTYDSESAMMELIATSLVYPKLNDKELMAHFNCVDINKMPLAVFSKHGEYDHVIHAFDVVQGFANDVSDKSEEESDIDKAKN